MTLFFIIGGIAVIAGITYMTITYFKTAAELEEARSELKTAKKTIRELTSPIEKYEVSETFFTDVKFGGF